MKAFVAVTLATLLAVVYGADVDVCHSSVLTACGGREGGEVACNSLHGGFKHAERDMQSYVNSQLATSYDYLLLSTHFNSYQKHRPGFEKLFKELSDKAWDNAVNLIKKITQRGGVTNLNEKHEIPSTISRGKQPSLEVDELHSLALALDSEKKLAGDAQRIHRRISRLDKEEHYDPEVSHFIEEKFLEEQASTIRKLSGYANDLAKLVSVPDPSLSVYLFDEYLQKQ